MATKILVAYSTRYSSTKGIADFIAQRLRSYGNDVDVRDVDDVRNPEDYDAYVVGSAVYMLHWLKSAREFVMRNSRILVRKPVWLFSSGPLGTEKKNAQGRDLRDVSGPQELGELRQAINPRCHRVFFGALDASKLALAHRMIRKMPAAREGLPEGDFRDWQEIGAWASEIAKQLGLPLTAPASQAM